VSTDIQTPIGGTEEIGNEHVVQSAQFSQLPATDTSTPPERSIEFLYDIDLQLSVELGRAEMTIREVMNMGIGTVIELNKLAGEPVDVLVNGIPIAHAEVVVVDDMFGVRVIDIISPQDRINSLK
jgi:flagellar motor switch protein FliN/FliY